MELLMVLCVICELIIIWRVIASEKKLKLFLETQPICKANYSDFKSSKFTNGLMLILLIAVYLYLRVLEAYIFFLPAVTLGIIQEVQKNNEITLYTNGIVIRRKYIEWNQIQGIERLSSNELLIVSDTLTFGQLKSDKLNNLDTLIDDIANYLGGVNKLDSQ